MELINNPQKVALCMAYILAPVARISPTTKAAKKALRLYAQGKATIDDTLAACWAADSLRYPGCATDDASDAACQAAYSAGRAVGAAYMESRPAVISQEIKRAIYASGRAAGWAAENTGQAGSRLQSKYAFAIAEAESLRMSIDVLCDFLGDVISPTRKEKKNGKGNVYNVQRRTH